MPSLRYTNVKEIFLNQNLNANCNLVANESPELHE